MEMLTNIMHEISKLFHSDHPLILMTSDTAHWLNFIWHYTVFETDNQAVAVSNIVIGLLLFALGLKLAKYLSLLVRKKLAKSSKIDYSAAQSLERISHYIFIILIAVFVLDVTNVPLTAFTVVGTTLALGIGLGSQTIANNFISGLIIMIERPIKLGDIIEIKNVVGKVTNIGARCVSLQTEDNINMLIPNSKILQDSVVNWTLTDTILKTKLEIHVDSTTSLERLDQIFYQAMSSNIHILKNPAPKVLLLSINQDGYHFELEFWINLEGNIDQKYIVNDINRAMEPFLTNNNLNIISMSGQKRVVVEEDKKDEQ